MFRGKKLKGSFTVEASFIVPLIFTVFVFVITMIFYYHDKNVVSSVCHETLAVNCGKEEVTSEDLEKYFDKKIMGKLLFFGNAHAKASVDKDKARLECTATGKRMSLHVSMSMKRAAPADYIRSLRRAQNIIPGLTD